MESSAAFGKVSFFGAVLGKEQRAPSTSLKLSIRLLEKRLTSNIIRYIFSKRDQHSSGLCILVIVDYLHKKLIKSTECEWCMNKF